MSALAGIDQALWDIKGKALGVSVSDLLGGQVRDKIRVYSWIGGDRPADTARAAKEAVARGFTAVKMNGTEERSEEHTSELQSLMRISYAVFCLKKKKTQ